MVPTKINSPNRLCQLKNIERHLSIKIDQEDFIMVTDFRFRKQNHRFDDLFRNVGDF